MTDGLKPSGPLRGVRVVEFRGLGPGPFAAMLLSDMGADVVCIDRVGPEADDRYDTINRGRHVVSLDLKTDVGRDSAKDLIAAADILIEGFRPGVMERLGLGPDVLLARNPALVYGRMTGWGQTGPLAQAAGHDITYIAVTGALAAIGPTDGAPVPPLNLVGDYGGGALYLVAGVLAALLEARRSGAGQVVDCAMCDGTVSLLSWFFSQSEQGRWDSSRRGVNVLDGGAPFYTVYECADGKHIAVGPIEPQFHRQLCELAGLPADVMERRADRDAWPALRDATAAVFVTRTRAEWCALLEGTDACVAPVLSMNEAPSHPHLAERGSFVTVDGVRQPAPAPRFSRTPSGIQSSPSARRTTVREVLAAWGEGTR